MFGFNIERKILIHSNNRREFFCGKASEMPYISGFLLLIKMWMKNMLST
jgi:hypothetical protein